VQRPPQIEPKSLADYLDMMSRALFSAGISWKVIEAKWEGTRKAFDGFDPEAVAAYNPDDIDRLMHDPGVVHNRKKIDAVVANAGELIVTDRDFGGFERYLASFEDNEDLVKDLHERFRFLGDFTAHLFLFCVRFNPDAQEKWANAQAERIHGRG
jgi:3-methyladenine DNA glycosylase Tag